MFSILIQIFLQCAGKMLTNDLLLDLWDDYFSEFSGTTLHTRNVSLLFHYFTVFSCLEYNFKQRVFCIGQKF